MRATIDRVTGQVSMYRLTVIATAAVLAMGMLLGALGELGFEWYGILGTLGVVMVATLGANEIAARLARVVPHRESSIITALLITCFVPPTLELRDLMGAAVAGIAAALSKYLIVWRGRHILNPAATGVVIAGFTQLTIGFWWIGTPAMLPVVALGALLLLDRTRRMDIGLIFIAVTVAIIGTRITLTGAEPFDAYSSVLLLFPVVFLAGYMLSEPQTLPPRRWQQWLVAVVTALVFSIPFNAGFLYTTPELALVVGNIVGFAVSRRGGFALRLTGSRALSDSATEFTFTPTRPVRFEAGQYLELHLPHSADRRGTRRIFSIASAPEHEQIALGMRTPDTGSSFKRVLRELDEGATVQATQVSGDFLLPRDPATPVVMVAGGIGVTPFASQLASATARGETRDVHVVYVPSRPDEVLYREVLEGAGATVTVLDRDTEITADALRELVPDLSSRRGYVSGAPSLVADAASALRRAGAKRVKTDYFAGY
ncbi:MAG TPA: FAD-dependent oxidoreductase [Microcella sp.]|nr:FAD-dependent oxidoreductase [Microcella sp.]